MRKQTEDYFSMGWMELPHQTLEFEGNGVSFISAYGVTWEMYEAYHDIRGLLKPRIEKAIRRGNLLTPIDAAKIHLAFIYAILSIEKVESDRLRRMLYLYFVASIYATGDTKINQRRLIATQRLMDAVGYEHSWYDFIRLYCNQEPDYVASKVRILYAKYIPKCVRKEFEKIKTNCA
jgi:hypothetical protein